MIGYITITFELNIEGPDGGLSPHEMVDQLEGALPKEWWTNIEESEWAVRRIMPGTEVTCEECNRVVNQYEQIHDFDAVLCKIHINEAWDMAKADQHYRDAE